ncbi:MAG TPA: DUF308 domain-containing protein [Allosphingosinicella sp.]
MSGHESKSGGPTDSPEVAVPNSSPPFAASSWEATLACGTLKILIAAAAFVLPLIQGPPLAETVGWMLLAGGVAEFALGWGAHRALLGKVTLGSGVLTVCAGILFLLSGWKGLFPLATITMVWLLMRGIISLDVGVQAGAGYGRSWFWLVLRGVTDLGLGLTLLIGLPMATFALLLFNDTREAVSVFGILLSISFAVAGVGLVAMAFSQRRRELVGQGGAGR